MTPGRGTRRATLAQVVVCRGCCCGRTDRGRPELPEEWLKAEWKARGLPKDVQLTISGCLGPCEIANVAVLWSAAGAVWLGPLTCRDDYRALLDWAVETATAGVPAAVPDTLRDRIFDRWRLPAVAVA